MTDTEFAESFTPVQIMHILVTRDLYWAHPERAYLISKLNALSFRWKKEYKPENLLRKLNALLLHWCYRNGTSITLMTAEAHKRFTITPSGLIEPVEGLAPFRVPKFVYEAREKGREKAPEKAPDKTRKTRKGRENDLQ